MTYLVRSSTLEPSDIMLIMTGSHFFRFML
nr:MAG TPA: hypothetical protein [Caudoviricetes sp.]